MITTRAKAKAACGGLWGALAALGAPAAAAQDGGFVLDGGGNGAAPFAARSGRVELGAGWVSNDSFKFGEYTGLKDKGLFAIAGFDFMQRATDDEGGAAFLTVRAADLGLASRSASAAAGVQGRYRVFADYAESPHYRLDGARTPFAGGLNLTLPSGWVAAATTTGMTALAQDPPDAEIATERTRYGGGFTWTFRKHWTLKASARVEDKDGLSVAGGMFGTNAGNALAATLPSPVDQTTRETSFAVAYADRTLQAEMSYRYTTFENDAASLTWRNPFAARSGYDPSQNFAAGGMGRLALAPDNTLHTLSATAGYTLDAETRLTGAFIYGRLTQNDPFLPYTVNGALPAPLPLPRGSLDGAVDTVHMDLNFTARPAPALTLRARYRYDRRDNDTPAAVFVGVAADTVAQGGPVSARARINQAYGYDNHALNLDGGYRLTPETRLTAGYDFERRRRDHAAAVRTTEHTGRLELRSRLSESVDGWVRYAYARRSGSDYAGNRAFLASHTAAYLATLAPEDTHVNDPLMRQYDVAARARHEARAGLTAALGAWTWLGVSGTYSTVNFSDTVIGLTDFDYASLTADLSMTPRDGVTAALFAAYEQVDRGQTSYTRGGGAFPPGAPRDPEAFWSVASGDRTYSAGARLDWAVIPGTLDVTLDYTLSRAVGRYDITAGALAPFLPLPDDKATLHALGAGGSYSIAEGLAVRLSYLFERYRSRDFAVDGVARNTIPTLIAFGEASPAHAVHKVGLALTRSF